MNNKYLKIPAGLLAVALLTLGAVSSLPAAELKIGVVNVADLMRDSPQARSVQRTLEDEFAGRKRDLETQQKEYKAREDQFTRNQAVMAEAERTKEERALREKQRDLQRLITEFQEDANVRQNEEIGRMQRVLLEEIQGYAKTQGFDLVLGEGVLFAKDAINITSQVLSALEAKVKPGAAPAPAKK